MGYIVRMPKLGVEMQTGVVLEWHAGEGESVAEGDVIAEIESEKTTAEVAARDDGVLRRRLLEPGAEVAPGTAMGIVAAADAAIDDLLAEAEAEGADVEPVDTTAEPAEIDPGDEPMETGEASTGGVTASGGEAAETAEPAGAREVPATPKARRAAADAGVDLARIEGTGPKGAVTATDVERAAAGDFDAEPGVTVPDADDATLAPVTTTGTVLATPRARKRAAERDVELSRLAGSGPHGAIRAADVETATPGATAPAPSPGEPAAVASPPAESAAPATAAGTDSTGRTLREERPLRGTRGTIARRLSESWEAPHVTVDREVEIEAALAAADTAPEVVSITDVVLKAVSESLAAHPGFNATLEDGVHRLYEEHNLGIAVDAEQGLLTPVIRGVDGMSVVEIAHRRRALVDRVQGRRHDASDLVGGTFTVTNLGVLGIDSFTPILNPPQVAILGVNRIREVPRRTDRGFEFASVMTFSLSFDHRAVDGADAARFLGTLAETLADAETILEE